MTPGSDHPPVLEPHMVLRWASVIRWLGRSGCGSGLRARPKRKDYISLFYSRNYFQCKNKFQKSRTCLEGNKNTQKILKIIGKFPEIDWDMSNPNKVFGADEKILEPSNK
jgi:hypothetical protein